MARIIITGGSGFIGQALFEHLSGEGHEVNIFSRSPRPLPFEHYWNIEEDIFDDQLLFNADVIINLAGAGIGEKRWSRKRRKLLFSSRIEPTEFIYKLLRNNQHHIKTFIAVSGVGYYGANKKKSHFEETDDPGKDLLARICVQWEKSSDKMNRLGIRTVILRLGVVMAFHGGAYLKMSDPIKKGYGAVLGTGNQRLSWIHIDDLVNLFSHTVNEGTISGVFNAVAPHKITNRELTESVSEFHSKRIWPVAIPGWVLKLIFGRRAILFLNDSSASATRIISSGFHFDYPKFEDFLKSK